MRPVLGVIIGNRGFFPDALAKQGRKEILAALRAQGCRAICLGPDDSKFGSVESWDDAKKCAELFKKNAGAIQGIVVTLPNFGDERGVADAIRMSGLDVPVLVQATPDDPAQALIGQRRDSFCGKISVCNNLTQYGIRFSLTTGHAVAVDSPQFAADLTRFVGVCRVVGGLKRARIGAIGARPAAFNTVRFSEKILEAHGISVETVDLSDVFGAIERLGERNARVTNRAKKIRQYVASGGVADEYVLKMARLATVLDDIIKEKELDACAVQCWTSMEENYGVVPCTVMSMLSEGLLPSACEVDVGGAIAMLAMQLASGTPSALLDWNNNYADDPDKCILFHCSNVPRSFFEEVKMDLQDIIGQDVGAENTFGTCVGRLKKGPLTFARVATDDLTGTIAAYVGQGAFTDDAVESFGGYGVAHIPGLQRLLRFICYNGYEHHVAVSLSSVADVLHEAFTNYLDFTTYHHE